jgi:acetoin utilization deacetylase AcuC-like enzyme
MTTLLVTHPCFVEHDMGFGHPERPDRMRALDHVFADETFAPLIRQEASLRADVEDMIGLMHPPEHYKYLRLHAPGPGAPTVQLDADTVMSGGTWEAALRAVGAGLDAVDAVLGPEPTAKNAFCQVRPPGHHAEKTTAMGFCLFANVAIAAKYAQTKYGVGRVAVIDFDVHHGNGTQDVFWNEPDLLLASTHQMPLFPGTGAVIETGAHDNICNAPLRSGDGGEHFAEAFRTRVLPAVEAFAPDMIMISAGFDAHADDPLANLQLQAADFQWATEQLVDIAERKCGGRLISMLEGGYDLRALAVSAGVHVRTLMSA